MKRWLGGLNFASYTVHRAYILNLVESLLRKPSFVKINQWTENVVKLLKPTGYMHQQVLCLRIVHSAHTVFISFVFISEQTATCAAYNIN